MPSTDIIIPAYQTDIMIASPLWRASGLDLERAIDEALPYIFGQADLPPLLQDKLMEISIVLTDDQTIQGLNKEFRGQDKPTNVLSFANLDAQDHDETLAAFESIPLGDVIMAYETLDRESREQEKSFAAHFTHLLAHGILHLLGYDHIDDQDAVEMETLETAILKEMGIDDPYQND